MFLQNFTWSQADKKSERHCQVDGLLTKVAGLADTAFGSVEFLKAMRKRGHPVIVGVRCDRQLADGRQVCHLAKKGQQVKLDGLPFPVTISWLYLKRDGKLEKRFVLSTRPLKGSTITWWGHRRWSIEGFFKTVNTPLWFTPVWSANAGRCLSLVCSLPH